MIRFNSLCDSSDCGTCALRTQNNGDVGGTLDETYFLPDSFTLPDKCGTGKYPPVLSGKFSGTDFCHSDAE